MWPNLSWIVYLVLAFSQVIGFVDIFLDCSCLDGLAIIVCASSFIFIPSSSLDSLSEFLIECDDKISAIFKSLLI